jgi:hypothetical protein
MTLISLYHVHFKGLIKSASLSREYNWLLSENKVSSVVLRRYKIVLEKWYRNIMYTGKVETITIYTFTETILSFIEWDVVVSRAILYRRRSIEVLR